jgi:hypothetical protein
MLGTTAFVESLGGDLCFLSSFLHLPREFRPMQRPSHFNHRHSSGYRGRGGPRRPHNPNGGRRDYNHRPAVDPFAENLSFSNFEFNVDKRVGACGGGVRELNALLRESKRKQRAYQAVAGTAEGEDWRNQQLIQTAIRRAAGEKIKDDPKRLTKTLAKRRNKKRVSAKRWAKRNEALKASVDTAVENRLAGKKEKKVNPNNAKAEARSEARRVKNAKKAATVKAKDRLRNGPGPGGKGKGGKGGAAKGRGKGKPTGGGRGKGGKPAGKGKAMGGRGKGKGGKASGGSRKK